jgi:UPF0755 protein
VTGGPPPVPGGRTPEEREAARRAREARRASRVDGDSSGRDWIGEARQLVAASSGRVGSPKVGQRRALAAGGVVLAALLVLWFLTSLFQPFKGEGDGRVRVVVPKGAGVGDIADLLERRGVVSNSFFFSLRAHLSGDGGDLKPGAYSLRKSMSYGAALDVLAKGPPSNIVTLTIPEGRSRREVARIVGRSLDGSYLRASRRSRALKPRSYGARRATSLEGFLFPATYDFLKNTTSARLTQEQLDAFRQNWKRVDLSYARSKNLTPYDVLIIASLVEKEALAPDERPKIARVIYNRLHARMNLGIDATTRYGLHVPGTKSLTQSQLASDNPYNTRNPNVVGLPPTPIANPGLASMQAAAHPAAGNWLYFVRKPDRVHHYFTDNFDDFVNHERQYGY